MGRRGIGCASLRSSSRRLLHSPLRYGKYMITILKLETERVAC
jgi:hypothetical protein